MAVGGRLGPAAAQHVLGLLRPPVEVEGFAQHVGGLRATTVVAGVAGQAGGQAVVAAAEGGPGRLQRACRAVRRRRRRDARRPPAADRRGRSDPCRASTASARARHRRARRTGASGPERPRRRAGESAAPPGPCDRWRRRARPGARVARRRPAGTSEVSRPSSSGSPSATSSRASSSVSGRPPRLACRPGPAGAASPAGCRSRRHSPNWLTSAPVSSPPSTSSRRKSGLPALAETRVCMVEPSIGPPTPMVARARISASARGPRSMRWMRSSSHDAGDLLGVGARRADGEHDEHAADHHQVVEQGHRGVVELLGVVDHQDEAPFAPPGVDGARRRPEQRGAGFGGQVELGRSSGARAANGMADPLRVARTAEVAIPRSRAISMVSGWPGGSCPRRPAR